MALTGVDWFDNLSDDSLDDNIDIGRPHGVPALIGDSRTAAIRPIRTAAQRGEVAVVESLIQDLRDTGCVIPTEVHNMMIHACARAGKLEQVEEYLTYMETNNIPRDAMSYNIVLNAYVPKGDLSQIHAVQQRMVCNGFEYTMVTYGTMCKAFARVGRVDLIEQVMARLEVEGLQVNIHFYRSLISACGVAQPPAVQRAEQALQELAQRGLRPQSVRRAMTSVVGKERVGYLFTRLGRVLAADRRHGGGMLGSVPGNPRPQLSSSSSAAPQGGRVRRHRQSVDRNSGAHQGRAQHATLAWATSPPPPPVPYASSECLTGMVLHL